MILLISGRSEGMIKGIDHIAITVTDLERSVDFYTEALGFEEVIRFRSAIPGIATIVFMKLGGCMIEVLGAENPQQFPGVAENMAGVKHLCLEVTDFEKEVDRLKGIGVKVIEEPHLLTEEQLKIISTAMKVDLKRGLKRAVFADPDGIPIELIQW